MRGQGRQLGENLRIEVEASRSLRFQDGSPVRAASGVARLGDGWLVVQDDATHGAWCRPAGIESLRILPPVDGHDYFSTSAANKHLKPDFEAVVALDGQGEGRVLVLGSGSTPARMRAALVTSLQRRGQSTVVDLSDVYVAVAGLLGVGIAELNLEGACIVGRQLRWFNRGNVRAGVPSASVDVDVDALLAVFAGTGSRDQVVHSLSGRLWYDLGEVAGVSLGITDAVTLADGGVLISAAAEDTPNAYDDGPVVGAVLALLEGTTVVAKAAVPLIDGRVQKVEGLAVIDSGLRHARVLAVVDDDDPELASVEHCLRLSWG